MSTNRSPKVKYVCSNDCRMEGCPGHEVSVQDHITSDTVTVLIDGQHYVTFNSELWDAVLLAWWNLYPNYQPFLENDDT